MPISHEALHGIKAAVDWNPHGARFLLSILREHASWVKYKRDDYGPLGLILFGTAPRKELVQGIDIPVRLSPFPDGLLPACKAFGKEWKDRQVTVAELADVLAQYLTRKK
jgi:hypothetical protein